MKLFGNNMARMSLQVLSIVLMISIENSYGYSAISIYNRNPILVIVLFAILLYGVFSKMKFSLCFEILSYISLFSLPLFRVIKEMEGFVTFNRYIFGYAEYVKFIIGLVLFFTLLIYYLKRIYSYFR